MNVAPPIDKVTAFVTRPGLAGVELLLIRHPYAGIQLPAGTVEEGEAFDLAALREAAEETGLKGLRVAHAIGYLDHVWSDGMFVLHSTTVYARPDVTSFDWARIPRGIFVRPERRVPGFVQITYEEGDRWPEYQYVTFQVTGWAPEQNLTSCMRRHFFHLVPTAPTPDDPWTVEIDWHRFGLFWAPLDTARGQIVAPQAEWLAYVEDELGYRFPSE